MELPFKPRERVRLARDVPPVDAGSEGVVIGYHNSQPLTYVVAFEEGMLSGLSPDDLVAGDEPEADPR
jgi:hypothetical protein